MRQLAQETLRRLSLRSFLIAFVLLALPSAGFAQANSNAATVSLSAALAESITVGITSGSSTSVTLAQGASATAGTPTVIATAWTLASSRSNVSLVGYFTTAAAALTNGGATVNIPSSEVFGSLAGGTGSVTSATAFTGAVLQGVGTAGGSLTLFTQPITSANYASSRSDTLTLAIDLTSQPQLPAGSYTGTLNLMAVAY